MIIQKKFTGSVKEQLLFVVKWGTLTGCAICLAVEFFPGNILWQAKQLLEWPCGMIWGYLMAAVAVMLRRTTVVIEGKNIWISRLGKRQLLELDCFASHTLQKKRRVVGPIVWFTRKITLLFYVLHGTKAYRLYEFTEADLDQVLEAIRIQKVSRMPVEEKIKVQDESNCQPESDELISTPMDEIIADEKKFIWKISCVWLGILLILAMVFANEVFQGTSMKQLDISLVLLIIMVLLLLGYVPIQRLILGRKIKMYAQDIRLDGGYIQINGKSYSFSVIERIALTSPKKKSDSIYPVQYYMYVYANGEKTKYWLGSGTSNGKYTQFCKKLEQAMVMYPNKLKYL